MVVVDCWFFCCSVGTLLQRFFLFTYLCNFSQIIYNVCAFHCFPFFAMYSRTKKLKKRFFLDMELFFFSFSKKNLSICHSKSVYPWKSWMILQKTEVMLCVCFVFTGKLDCLFCIFAWWIIVLTVLMRFHFFSFFSGRFFKLNGDLPAIYCDKNPQVVFILFFSARSNFCFWSVMLRFDDFFSSCTMYLKMFFLRFRNFRKRKYSIQNRKWHIWLFFRWTAVQV